MLSGVPHRRNVNISCVAALAFTGSIAVVLVLLSPMIVVLDPGHRGSSWANSTCKCFQVCDNAGMEHLLAHLPDVIESSSSPWYAYLKDVYHDDVALPFDMTKLRFIYFRTERWAASHPASELPVFGCPGEPLPWCEEQVCRQWYVNDSETRRSYYRAESLERYTYGPSFSVNGIGFGEPNSLVYDSGLVGGEEPQGVSFFYLTDRLRFRSNHWIEVTRFRSNYFPGFWLTHAPGSGIWLNTGRSWRQRGDGDNALLLALWRRHHSYSQEVNLTYLSEATREWGLASNRPRGVAKDQTFGRYDSISMSTILMAYDLDFDTLQFQRDLDNERMVWPAVVVTAPQSLVDLTCCPECSPLERAEPCRHRGWRERTCGFNIEYREGPRANLGCACSDSFITLTCKARVSSDSASDTTGDHEWDGRW
jgi:hypothetical protein